jgi:hypothetical protein
LPKVGNYELVASIDGTVNDTGSEFETDIDLITTGPHTLLLTCFIDITGFDLESQNEQNKGSGLSNSTVRATENFLFADGEFTGGWDPTITLLG